MRPVHESLQNVHGQTLPLQPSERPVAIVDDDIDDQATLKRAVQLAFGDVPVLGFQSGAGLIHYLHVFSESKIKPRLILLDLDMPKTSGLSILEILRGDPAMSDIPVVVVSGTLNRRHIEKSFACGSRAFLPKSLSRQELAAFLVQAPLQEGVPYNPSAMKYDA